LKRIRKALLQRSGREAIQKPNDMISGENKRTDLELGKVRKFWIVDARDLG